MRACVIAVCKALVESLLPVGSAPNDVTLTTPRGRDGWLGASKGRHAGSAGNLSVLNDNALEMRREQNARKGDIFPNARTAL